MKPLQKILRVLEKSRLGPYTLIKIQNTEVLRNSGCGQFLMAGLPKSREPFLSRPLSFFENKEEYFSLLLKIKGRGTELLAELEKGDEIKIFGPLGNAFKPRERGVLIAGGIGIAPLYYQSKCMKGGKLFYGTREEANQIKVQDFARRDFEVFTISEEDGGTVCDLVKNNIQELKDEHSYICGPEPMIKILSKIFKINNLNGSVYMERRMGCGTGGCKSCAVNTESGYKLVCKDGPLFKMDEVIFD